MAVFGIVIVIVLLTIGFFHWIQGFFSATISAIVAIVAAVVALSYHEVLLQGVLANMSPNWMPALTVLGLFALTYILLRTIFDKVVPGGMMLPPVVDKVGGAVMGLVAGCFGLGVVVIAAQLMPFGSSIGGYTRYQVKERTVTVPSPGGSKAAKEAATYDDVDGDYFEDNKRASLFPPVDDIVVSTISHLSDQGSLSAGRPFKSVHPDYLEELYGQRLGIQTAAYRSIINLPSKGQTAVEVVGVYTAPTFAPTQIVDTEFKLIREAPPVNLPPLNGDRRIVVRMRFPSTPEKDRKLRLSPAAVRLVAMRPSPTTGELEPRNHYPIGTIEPNGLLYANKIDDYLFIDVPAKKVDGDGDGPAEVDFVFQVNDKGFYASGDSKSPDAKIADGTFVEVKRFGRVDLSAGDIKSGMPRLPVLAVKRKHLEVDGGPAPMVPGKAAAVAAARSVSVSSATPGGGGGVLGERLAGAWETRAGLKVSETLTFSPDGLMKSVTSNGVVDMRWIASGPPRGEILTIQTAPVGTELSAGEKRTITFEDDNQFSMSDSSGGTRRFKRSGAAPPAAAGNVAPDEVKARLSGIWDNGKGLSYTFRLDGTYTGAQAAAPGVEAKSASGVWEVTGAEANNVLNVKLTKTGGQPVSQKWDVTQSAAGEITRVDANPPMTFKRKS